MNNTFFYRLLTIAALLGAIGVMMGAFGAHALKSKLAPNDLETIRTGVFYLFVHVLATGVLCAMASFGQTSPKLKSAGLLFVIGVCLFSGSLFVIATKTLTGFPASAIGFVTPLGGLCFIAGWVLLALHAAARRL